MRWKIISHINYQLIYNLDFILYVIFFLNVKLTHLSHAITISKYVITIYYSGVQYTVLKKKIQLIHKQFYFSNLHIPFSPLV